MNQDRFGKFLAFLERLDREKVPYRLTHDREGAVSVVAYAPGEYWEIDFLADGEVDVERFRSNGHIDDESVLEELFALWAEPKSPTPEPEKHDGIAARK